MMYICTLNILYSPCNKVRGYPGSSTWLGIRGWCVRAPPGALNILCGDYRLIFSARCGSVDPHIWLISRTEQNFIDVNYLHSFLSYQRKQFLANTGTFFKIDWPRWYILVCVENSVKSINWWTRLSIIVFIL